MEQRQRKAVSAYIRLYYAGYIVSDIINLICIFYMLQNESIILNKQQHKEFINLLSDALRHERNTNLIINYLPSTITESALSILFSPYGTIQNCKIVIDPLTLKSRGYGFIKYDNSSSAQRAIKAINGYQLRDKKLKVSFARKQCKSYLNTTLFVSNIPSYFTNDRLENLFIDFGHVTDCRIINNKYGGSYNSAFITMDTFYDAIQVLQEMNEYVIDDKTPPMLVKIAQGQRSEQLRAETCNCHCRISTELIFRASHWSNSIDEGKFNVYCNEKGSVICVVKTEDNSIYGGYISKPWKSLDVFWKEAKRCPNSCLFEIGSQVGNKRMSEYSNNWMNSNLPFTKVVDVEVFSIKIE